MEVEGDQGLMGLMGRMDQVLILIVQVTSTTVALITALESPGMETTPTMALNLTRLLHMAGSPVSLTLHRSASVRRRRRTMVVTHLHHHITMVTRLRRRHLLTVLIHRRLRRRHHHHMAISPRLPRPVSVLLLRPVSVLLLRLPTAGSGRVCSASSIHMDPHRRCPGNTQIGRILVRTVIRITGTDTDTREDHLIWGMKITMALLVKITRDSTVTTKHPMSLSDFTNTRASPSTRTTTIISLPTTSKDPRPSLASKKLAGKTGICPKVIMRSLKMPGPPASRTITPTCPGRLSSVGLMNTGPRRTTDPMITMSSTVTTLPLLALRHQALLRLDLPHRQAIMATDLHRHLTVHFSSTSPQQSLP